MARMVHVLLKIPAVRRVMFRLGNAEANLQDQHGRIEGQQSRIGQLSDNVARLSTALEIADGRSTELARVSEQVAVLSKIMTQFQTVVPRLNGRIEQLAESQAERGSALAAQIAALNDMISGMHTALPSLASQIAEVSQHMPPDRRTALEAQVAALNEMTSQLNVMLPRVSERIEQLAAAQAEIAQHMPPERRTALEAQVHALNEAAGRSAILESKIEALQARTDSLIGNVVRDDQSVAKLRQEIRILRVGHGATFEELIKTGKIAPAEPYCFKDLLSFRNGSQQSTPSVPPLVFIHVPKASGTTINNILMKNYKYRADSYGSDFFPRYFPDEFLELVGSPLSPDDRVHPAFFTGHIGLSNELFRRMPVPFVAVTMLRDPVERVVSHFRFNSTVPSVFQTAIVEEGLDVIEYFQKFRSAIPSQYQYFLTEERDGEDETSRVNSALDNLERCVSLFGLQERFDEFVVLMREFIGIPNVSYTLLNRTPTSAAKVTQGQIAELQRLLTADIAFYETASNLYRTRIDGLQFDLAAKVEAFKNEQDAYARQRRLHQHPWGNYYS